MALSDTYRSIMNNALSAYDQETKAAQQQENLYKEKYATERDRGLKDSYVNYMQGKRDLPQMLSYLGYTGGPAETSTLKLNTEYEQGRQDKETTYLDALKELTAKYAGTYADINSRRSAAQAQYEAQIAQAMADEEAAAAAARYSSGGGYSRSSGGSSSSSSSGNYPSSSSGTKYGTPTYAWSGYADYLKQQKVYQSSLNLARGGR